MLRPSLTDDRVEAGCDEAGRGCLAGPVFAAAVILPKDYRNPMLNDSKQLTARQREKLKLVIEQEAIAFAVEAVDHKTIDEINILNASFLAMHKAIGKLPAPPQLILVDGNRFRPYPGIPHKCIVKGDSLFASIAAASILAKTYRDDFMRQAGKLYPNYGWGKNKGYPTKEHREAIAQFGISELHRLSFRLGRNEDLFSDPF